MTKSRGDDVDDLATAKAKLLKQAQISRSWKEHSDTIDVIDDSIPGDDPDEDDCDEDLDDDADAEAVSTPPEEELFVLHHHKPLITKDKMKGLGFILLAIAVLYLLHKYSWSWYLAIGLIIIGLAFFFHAWVKWNYTVIIVTTRRIREITQHSLFKKTVFEVNLNKIQHISYNIHGLGSIFDYGDISLSTMVGDMVLTKIDHCGDVVDRLTPLLATAEEEEYDEEDEEFEEQARR